MKDPETTPHATPNHTRAFADILAWSKVRPLWQRDALRRLCETGGDLDANDLDELTDLCVRRGVGGIPLAAEHMPSVRGAEATVTLDAIHSTSNVNALKDGQRLTFDKAGMTIVFGYNGSGKSGYARILKKACRARRTAQDPPVLPNIYAKQSSTPKAMLRFTADGQAISGVWEDGKDADALLSAVSLFDSSTAGVHVDRENDVAYTPLPLLILERLAEVCRQVKRRIEKTIAELEKQTPAVLSSPGCHEGTAVDALLRTLSGETSKGHVAELAALTDSEEQRWRELTSELANPIGAIKDLGGKDLRLEEASRVVGRLQAAVSDDRVGELVELYESYMEATAAAEAAASTLFEDVPLDGVGSTVWRRLWEAARTYSEVAYPGSQYPDTDVGSRCVLCQQELDDGARRRLQRFEEFVLNELEATRDQAELRYRHALQALKGVAVGHVNARNIVRTVSDASNRASPVDCRRSLTSMRWRLRSILRLQGAPVSRHVPNAVAWPSAEVDRHRADLSSRIAALDAAKNSALHQAMRAELEQLQDRLWLSSVKDDVIREIDRRSQCTSLRAALGETKTNAVTGHSREVANTLVTNALRAQFAREVEALGLSKLAVELRTGRSRYGVPRFRVSLIQKPDAPVGKILSEGEHRCVALAAFLAEISTSDSKSAIVFDDPVSSLDHNHREQVANRLARECLSRQVVLFTHDITFLFLLDGACRRHQAHLGFRSVNRTDTAAGFVQKDPPAHAQPVNKLIESMQKQLDNERRRYDHGDHNEWEKTADTLLKRLRSGWERAVEEFVGPVLRRLSSKVQTAGLTKLTVLQEVDCRQMRAAYGRCSSLLHSLADSMAPQVPNPEVIQEEIESLRSWAEGIRDRQDAIRPLE